MAGWVHPAGERQATTSGWATPRAVFPALEGTWTFERTITGMADASGAACFTRRGPDEYAYRERARVNRKLRLRPKVLTASAKNGRNVQRLLRESLSLAYRALAGGGALPTVLNAANEEAVSAFLDRRVPFPAIPESIQEVLEEPGPRLVRELDDILNADAALPSIQLFL